MGSPVGPVLAEIFMIYFLEQTLMPKLENLIKSWKRYIDNTITYITPDSLMDIINILNKFYENIKFTYKKEHDSKISSSDVLIMRIYHQKHAFKEIQRIQIVLELISILFRHAIKINTRKTLCTSEN